jgi:hypothetical protein
MKSCPFRRKPEIDLFDLPVFDKPQIERWPVDITWDQAMHMFDASESNICALTIRPQSGSAAKIPSRSAWIRFPAGGIASTWRFNADRG